MRRLALALTVGGLTLGLLAATSVQAQEMRDGPVPVRVRYFEGSVTVQRAQAGETGTALVNLPLDPGDRLWTDEGGRVELELADGSLLWVDEHTTLDVVSLAGTGDAILRMWGGSLIVGRDGGVGTLRIDLPEASVAVADRALARLDVEAGRSWLSVVDGSAQIAAGGITELVAAGERSYAETGTAPAEPVAYNTAEQDGFDSWQAERIAELSRVVEHVTERSYVPNEVARYAADLETSGSWFYYDQFDAWAWRPQVTVSWAPYRHGRWVYSYGGWTWVSYEPWGWVTGHYGRWHHLPAYGWVWFPGRVYSPAWVSWYVGGSYVGWCPLGFYDRPLISIDLWFGGHRGYGYGYNGRWDRYDGYRGAVPRGKVVAGRGYVDGPASSWTFVHGSDLGRADGVRHAVEDRHAVLRGTEGNAVSLQGALRPRNPAVLAAGAGRRMATPRGGSLVAPTPRPGESSTGPRVAVGRSDPRPDGRNLGRPASGGTQVAVPRPGTTGGDLGGNQVSPPRPRPSSDNDRVAVPRPRGGSLAPTPSPRPAGGGVRVITPRPGGTPIPSPAPRPGSDRVIAPRPRGGDAAPPNRSWFTRPGGTTVSPRPAVIVPRGSAYRRPVIAPRSAPPRMSSGRAPVRAPAPRVSVPRPPAPRAAPRSSGSGSRSAVRRGSGSRGGGSSSSKARKAKPRKPGGQQ